MGRSVLRHVAELHAVVGQYGVDPVRDGFDQRLQEGDGGPDIRRLMQLGEGELGGPVNRHEEMELAFL